MAITTSAADLARHLFPGERLLWSGAPQGGLRLRPSDIFLIPFSLVWCGFAVFWTYSVGSTNAPGFFSLWGLMFVAVGLYFVFGRFITDAIRRGKTTYGITSQRVLIVGGLFSRDLRSINVRAVPEISLALHSDGTGTVTFGTNELFRYPAFRGWPAADRTLPPAFEFIANPEEAHRLVLELQKATSGR